MSDKQEIIILGWFYSGEHEPETVPCPDCEGSGEVIAFVTIDWRPNKR